MEDKLLSLLMDRAGITVVLFYLIGKYSYVFWKKHNGNYVSYKEIMAKINALENNFNGHLSTAQKRANRIELLEKTQEIINQNISGKINDIQEAIRMMTSSIDDLKNFLIENKKK